MDTRPCDECLYGELDYVWDDEGEEWPEMLCSRGEGSELTWPCYCFRVDKYLMRQRHKRFHQRLRNVWVNGGPT